MTVYLSKEPVMVTSKHKEDPYILIFKTNIKTENELQIVGGCLSELKHIIGWNVDREDIDNVLRIESKNDNVTAIISCMNNAGFFCEELN